MLVKTLDETAGGSVWLHYAAPFTPQRPPHSRQHSAYIDRLDGRALGAGRDGVRARLGAADAPIAVVVVEGGGLRVRGGGSPAYYSGRGFMRASDARL